MIISVTEEFHVTTALPIQIVDFWVVTAHSLVGGYKFWRHTPSPCKGLIATVNMAAAGHIAMLISVYRTALS